MGGVGSFHLASSWGMAKPWGPAEHLRQWSESAYGLPGGTQGAGTVPRATRRPCCPSKPASPAFVQSKPRLAQLPTALSLPPQGHWSPWNSLALSSLSLSLHFSEGAHLSLPLLSQFSSSHLLFTPPSSFSLSLSSLSSFLYPL